MTAFNIVDLYWLILIDSVYQMIVFCCLIRLHSYRKSIPMPVVMLFNLKITFYKNSLAIIQSVTCFSSITLASSHVSPSIQTRKMF